MIVDTLKAAHGQHSGSPRCLRCPIYGVGVLVSEVPLAQPLPGSAMTMNRGVCESYDVQVSSVISSYGV